MKRSLALRIEPTVRQTEAILGRIERALAERGVSSERVGTGRLDFRMPHPWRTVRQGPLLAISRGAALVSAGAGDRRRVRYELNFRRLRVATVVLSLVLVAIGFRWPRLTLLNALLMLWLLVPGIPYALAAWRFHALMAEAARDVLERRLTPREGDAVVVRDPAGGDGPGADTPGGETTTRR